MNNIQEINIDTENDLPNRKVPADLNLSVFRYDWSWKTWRGFWKNLAYFFRCWRPAWDRATKGYCRMDTWNVDYSMTAYMIKVLVEYRNVTNGWPDSEFETFEEWIAAIDECIDQLIFSAEEPDKLNKHWSEYQKFALKNKSKWTDEEHDIFLAYLDDVHKVYEMQCEARKKAFTFLGEYLPHIWW